MRAAKLGALGVCLSVLCGLLAGSAMARSERVVILPVVVHSASQNPGYVSRGISDMLSARLEQAGGLVVVPAAEDAVATVDGVAAIQAAKQAGGDYVLYGSFTQFGDGASLDIRCAPVQGDAEARSIFIQSGTMGEIIPKLDGLADKVARYVRGEAPPAEAVAGNGAARAEDYDELKQRLENLERAVFPPVAPVAEVSEDLIEAGEDMLDVGEEPATQTEVAEESPES